MKKAVCLVLMFLLLFSFSACTADSGDGGDTSGNLNENQENNDTGNDGIDNGFLNMGMNISGTGYYHSRVLMFNDVMKTKHEIGTASRLQGGYTGEKTAEGYPKEVVLKNGWDPDAPVILINDIYSGDYVFLYDGDGDIEFAEGIEVISAQSNKTYLKLTECVQTATNDPHRRVIIR